MVNFEHRSNIGTHPALADGTVGTVNRMDSLIGGRPPVLSRPEATHVPVGSLVTVTIGRNTSPDGSTELRRPDWLRFQGDVSAALRDYCDVTFGPFDGVGEWQGVRETSAVFTAIVARPFAPGKLDETLGQLAELYGQDAIAWSFGSSRLVGPNA